MVRAPRTVRVAAAVILLLAAPVCHGADRSPAGAPPRPRESPKRQGGQAPSPRGDRKPEEARLDTVKIVGKAEHPAVLFVLPPAEFRLLPLRPEADPATGILRDDKVSGERPGS